MFVIGVSSLLSYYLLNFLGDAGAKIMRPVQLAVITILLIILCFAFLLVSGAYSKLWRYFKLKDYISCFAGTALGSIVVFFLSYLIFSEPNLIYFCMQFLMGTVGIVLFRILFRKTFLVLVDEGKSELKKRTLIVGAGQACNLILKEIENAKKDPNNPSNEYLPICIVDDDPKN